MPIWRKRGTIFSKIHLLQRNWIPLAGKNALHWTGFARTLQRPPLDVIFESLL